MNANILILDDHAETYRDGLRAEFPDLPCAIAHDLSDLPQDLSHVEALISFCIGLNDDFFRRADRLRWVQCLSTGVDHLRHRALRPDTVLTNGRGIHGAPLRESVVYLMMAVSRESAALVEAQRAHHWRRQYWSIMCGKTAVIAGIGVVGTAVAQILKAFGMHVVGVTHEPRAVEGFDEIMPREQLTDAVRRADYLINVLPAEARNARVFDRAMFEAMKPSAYFINVGRGKTVDEAALVSALREGRIAGAGLDVFQTEPLPVDSPLWDAPNLFIAPHLGGLVREYASLIMPLIIGNVRHFLAGELDKLQNIVKR